MPQPPDPNLERIADAVEALLVEMQAQQGTLQALTVAVQGLALVIAQTSLNEVDALEQIGQAIADGGGANPELQALVRVLSKHTGQTPE